MKTSIYKNCSLVRIPIKAGTEEYQIPQNVVWAGCKVDRIAILAPKNACTDPVDGVTPVMTASDLTNCYISLYDSDNRELMHDVSFEQIVHTNNHPLMVDAVLNLSLCKIFFTSAPAQDCTLLLYVFYGTREEEYYDIPKNSMTVTFPLDANEEISFRKIIDYAIHALPETIKGIICWNAETAPAWLLLRDHDLTYQMTNLHTELFRPDVNGGSAASSQAALFLVDSLDIDFDYSRIREASGNASTQKITFLY
jgi:hypothetical protein